MTETGWKRRRVTIKDIAAAAEVDPSTVTRALQNSPRVRAATLEKIQRLAREMGYVPNMAARTLVTSRSGIIGLVLPDMTNPFFAELARGIEEEASKHSLRVLTRNTDGVEAAERDAIGFFTELKVDGLVIAMSRSSTEYFKTLETPVPVVHVNRDDLPHHVSCDRYAGSRQIVDHMLKVGHRRIALVTGPAGPAQQPKRTAYVDALEAHGIEYNPNYIFTFNGELQDTRRVVDELLALEHRPTAVFAWNDLCALGLIRHLSLRGLRVPDDISVAGHDDIAIARFMDPPLSTVHWPMYELGQESIRYLYQLRQNLPAQPPSIPSPTVRLRGSIKTLEP